MPKTGHRPEDYIVPLNINGLEGRLLHAPSTSNRNREILLIYGHHAMLERWWGLVENLRAYGNVTMPDLPGFGGMESMAKIGTKPNVDAFADYLAAFIKLRYRNKRITIYAISYGFVVVTRMLQRYPELVKKVDLLVGYAGFMHNDDLLYRPATRQFFRLIAGFLATRPVAFLIRYVGFNRPLLRFLYKTFPKSKRRMIEITPEEFATSIEFEMKLWRSNDVRTHWLTTSEFLNLNNLKKHINLPVVHVVSEGDHYLANINVEQHMRQVFSDYFQFISRTKAHVPHILSDKKAFGVMLPPGLRRLLSKKPS
jgi:pimeloyl-ACP methyl ester carboxylesterase